MQEFCTAIRPVRHHNGAWQAALFGDAWQTILTGDGTAPAAMPDGGWFPSACLDFWGDGHLLLLANPDGYKTTWVLDEGYRTLCDLADPALDRMPGVRQVLSGPAIILRRTLRSHLAFRADSVTGTALRGIGSHALRRFLALAEGRARSLSVGAFAGTLSLPSVGSSVGIASDALARLLNRPAGWQAAAMEAGRVRILAVGADGPVDSVFLLGRTGASPIYLCVENRTGLRYYLVCRDGAPPALYFPNDNLFVSRDGLDAATARSLLDALDASAAGVASALAVMDVSLLPDSTDGLGVLAFGTPDAGRDALRSLPQEVDALGRALASLPPGHHPPTLYVVESSSGLDQLGPVEDLVPEFAGRVIRFPTEAACFAHAIASGTELVLLEGSRSSSTARGRIGAALDHAGSGSALAEQVRAACTRDGHPRLVVTLGFRLADRRLPDLLGFYGRLATALAGRFGPVVVLLAGDAGPGAAEGSNPGAVADGQAWVAAFRDMLGTFEAEAVDCTGLSDRDSLCWLRHSTFFVAPLSDGLARLRWVLDIPGLVLLEEDEAAEGHDPLCPYMEEAALGGPAAPLYSGRMDGTRLALDSRASAPTNGRQGRPQPRTPVLHEDGLIQRIGDLIDAQAYGSGIAIRPSLKADPRSRTPKRRPLRDLFSGRRRAPAVRGDGGGGSAADALVVAPAPSVQLSPAPRPVPQGPGLRCIDVTKDYPSHHGRRRVLDRVNFGLERGQRLGVLGRNGAGKSTLIRIIGGVDFPTAGQVVRDMSISWPLGFTGAFQGSLSGIDNLRFICRIYGLDYDATRAYVDDFAELGQQLGEPVKTYSSGMRARLAFALSIAIEFECYLIDEVIMVGDRRFARRCHQELFDKRADRSIILVSHSMDIIRDVCNSAAVIHDSHFSICDSVADAISYYESM